MQALAQVGRISLQLMGRQDGSEELPSTEWSSQTMTEVGLFSEIAASMRHQSALLALQDTSDKESIYAAYTRDLALLQRYQTDCEAWVREAVRCSIIARGSSAKRERERWEATWQLLKEQVPSGTTTLLIDFPFTRASLPAPQLCMEMKSAFNRGIEQILTPLAAWLQVLVEMEFIGLVEWGDLDVCRYHYFKHEVTDEVVREQRRHETSFDASQPFGSRTQITGIRDRNMLRRQFHERHVHHIIRAKLHRFEEYPHRVPKHVAVFINAMPTSLQPHVHIVEGTITMEEVFRRQVGEQEFVASEVLSVHKYSPGVLLGHFNLLGWSGDDLKSGSVFYAIQEAVHKQARKRRAAERKRRLIGHLFTA